MMVVNILGNGKKEFRMDLGDYILLMDKLNRVDFKIMF